jgi:uncharacterized membrane protein
VFLGRRLEFVRWHGNCTFNPVASSVTSAPHPRGIEMALGRPGPAKRLAAVALSGAGTGFFAWWARLDPVAFRSFYFRNNLPAGERVLLLAALLGAAGLFALAWTAVFLLLPLEPERRRVIQRTAGSLGSLGILLGFWPLLSIPALEVYYPVQVFLLVIGATAVLLLVVRPLFVAPVHLPEARPGHEWWGLPAVLALAVGYAAFFGLYTVRKHLAFHSYAFDLGWQNQVFFTLLHTGNPRVTGFITLEHFSNHFQPLYYLLAPIYALRQDPATLIVLQAVLLPTAAVPLFLIARRRLANTWIALAVAAGYLLYPALHGLNTYDFHGVVLLIPILCFLLYFLETGRMGWYWACFLLALITREDVPVTLLGVGLYEWLALGKRRLAAASIAACAAYFAMTLAVMTALGGAPNLENYRALGLPEHQDYTGVLMTALSNPAFVFRHVFLDTDNLVYLLQILAPVCFLPLFTGRRLVLLVPGLAIILLSNTSAQYSIGFQYSAHVIAPVFFLSILGIETIDRRWPKVPAAALAVTLLASGLAMDYEFGLVASKRFPGFLAATDRERAAYSFFRMIPGDASVATISRLYPHLSGRAEIYLLERMRVAADFVLADLYPASPASDTAEVGYRGHTQAPSEVRQTILRLLADPRYGAVRFEEGFVLLERGYPPDLNARVSRAITAFSPPEAPEIVPYFRDPATGLAEPRLSESDRLAGFLQAHQGETMLLATSGDAVSRMSYLGFKYLMYRWSAINRLRARGSYVGVLRGDAMAFEVIDNRAPVEVDTAASVALRAVLPGLSVTMRSAGRSGLDASGRPFGPGCSIVVDGVECSPDRPGMNVVVLDDRLRVREAAAFATGGGAP